MGFMDKLKGAGGAGGMGGMAGMGMPSQEDLAMVQRLTRLNQVGVDQPATIRHMQATGRTDISGEEYAFDVEVQPAGGAPYAASFKQFMHPGSMGSWAYAGAAVKVRVDPEDASSMILWGSRG